VAVNAVTMEGVLLSEPEGGPFVESIEFIVLMVALVVLIVILAVVIFAVARYKITRKKKAERRYHCKLGLIL